MSKISPGNKPAYQSNSTSTAKSNSTNTTKSYSRTPEEEATDYAWRIDDFLSIWIYFAWGNMYLWTIVPPILAMPFISVFKASVNISLLVDMLRKKSDIGSHPAKEAYIWTMDNWWKYSFRRWIIDLLLIPLHVFTQAIPIANWLLILIPFLFYYANVMVL